MCVPSVEMMTDLIICYYNDRITMVVLEVQLLVLLASNTILSVLPMTHQ